jgi:hypothetical protein
VLFQVAAQPCTALFRALQLLWIILLE